MDIYINIYLYHFSFIFFIQNGQKERSKPPLQYREKGSETPLKTRSISFQVRKPQCLSHNFYSLYCSELIYIYTGSRNSMEFTEYLVIRERTISSGSIP